MYRLNKITQWNGDFLVSDSDEDGNSQLLSILFEISCSLITELLFFVNESFLRQITQPIG